MKIIDNVKHSDGVWIQAVVDTTAELTTLDNDCKAFFKTNDKPIQGSIVYVTGTGDFYVKNAAGEYIKAGASE